MSRPTFPISATSAYECFLTLYTGDTLSAGDILAYREISGGLEPHAFLRLVKAIERAVKAKQNDGYK